MVFYPRRFGEQIPHTDPSITLYMTCPISMHEELSCLTGCCLWLLFYQLLCVCGGQLARSKQMQFEHNSTYILHKCHFMNHSTLSRAIN